MMADTGAVVSYHGINYDVQVKTGNCCSKSQPKRILQDVSGIFRSGAMNAILGSTGSGKTTLLDILAGRKERLGLEGAVLVNGQAQQKNFRLKSGYVVQDDVVMGTLTIRENLLFSANLRLPRSKSAEERMALVTDIISELGLSHVADSKVGNEFIRGVSGGERKRTNIGMELIISPSVLFLDEPTTGLDASTANTVMNILYRLSRHGRTIVFSIHQPRYSIFRLFDELTLLSQGQCMYHGPAQEAVKYFTSIGYQCESFNNPPDFFLDLINGDLESTRTLSVDEEEEYEEESADVEQGLSVASGRPYDDDTKLVNFLKKKFRASEWQKRLTEELDPIYEEHVRQGVSGLEVTADEQGYATGFGTQFYYLSWRCVLNILRNPQTSIAQIFIMSFLAIIVGIIYLDIGYALQDGIQNRIGVFFFIVMNMVFGNLSAVELFIKERAIFLHENANGFYRVSAYFVSKIFCDVVPMRVIPISIFACITYFMIGFQVDVDKFFVYLLMLNLTSLAAAGIGFFFSAVVRVFAIANLFIALTYVFMMVFGGFLVNLSTMAGWLRWIRYLSLFHYSLNGFYINELKNLTLCVFPNGTDCNPDVGNKFLQSQDIPYETTWDFWVNPTALFIMAFVLFLLTYITLRRLKKFK